MLKTLRLFGCFVFLFGLFVGTEIAAAILQAPHANSNPQAGPDPSRQAAFELIGMGEMRDEDGTHLAFTTYKALDGTKLTAIHNEFDSSTKAQAYFDTTVAKVQKIIQRGEKKNGRGNVIGNRAEAVIQGVKGSVPAVMWTDGPHYHEIISSSAMMNRELERQLTR
jgi:hypothetical protein